jgi:drug/metabolite transporter (DMT)-like permease
LHLQHWFWLFLAQTCWAGSYVAMKLAAQEMPVGTVIFLRYGIVSLLFLAAMPWLGIPRFQRRDLLLVVVLGALDFALAPTLQVGSLLYTQAIDASILIALEPMMAVLVAAVALRERPSRSTIFALIAGTIGMLVLSGAGFGGTTPGASHRLLGNLMFTASLLCESAVTVAGRTLAPRYRPSHLVFSMKMAGFFVSSIIYAPVIASTNFGSITMRGWESILFLSILASMFGYTVWYRIIRVVPVSYVALSLFIQPLVGTMLGYTLLGEEINLQTLVGALVVCVSLAWWQLRTPIPEATPAGGPTAIELDAPGKKLGN